MDNNLDKKNELWNELIQYTDDLNYFFRKQLDFTTLKDIEYAFVLSDFIRRDLEQLRKLKEE